MLFNHSSSLLEHSKQCTDQPRILWLQHKVTSFWPIAVSAGYWKTVHCRNFPGLKNWAPLQSRSRIRPLVIWWEASLQFLRLSLPTTANHRESLKLDHESFLSAAKRTLSVSISKAHWNNTQSMQVCSDPPRLSSASWEPHSNQLHASHSHYIYTGSYGSQWQAFAGLLTDLKLVADSSCADIAVQPSAWHWDCTRCRRVHTASDWPRDNHSCSWKLHWNHHGPHCAGSCWSEWQEGS